MSASEVLYSAHPPQVKYPLYLRQEPSDAQVFKQIFIDQEYSCLDSLTNVGLIIDCGANIGCSSAYFLSKYPSCQVIAVEPDSANFALLQRNLLPYGDRVKALNAGIWSASVPMVISEIKYRDGLAWARQVRPARPGEKPQFSGVSIQSLLELSACERISILKIDIEGSECVVFYSDFQSWLDKTDVIAIELHDDSFFGKASEIFYRAIEGKGFDLSKSGELVICRRRESA